MRRLWHTIFTFWERYEHHIGMGSLVVGFFFDLIIADRPDSVSNNLLLLSYIFVAGALIVFLNLHDRRRTSEDHPEPLFLLLVLQFCFGGLASNLLVLYGRSGTLAGSALFVGLLIVLFIGNEYLRSRYSVLKFNVAVYYFLVLTYCVIAVPTFLFHSIGNWQFLGSVLVSLLYIAGFLAIIFYSVFRGEGKKQLYEVSTFVVLIFCVFTALYFLNVIPPVPLALKDIGVYHSVLRREDGGYIVLYERSPWYQFWRNTNEQYLLSGSKSAFCFSSVFAPTDLAAPIYHRWEYFDETTNSWQTRSRVSFPISGGRNNGYRGFSVKSNVESGKWRCDVETAAGALIGRVSFVATEPIAGQPLPELSQKTL